MTNLTDLPDDVKNLIVRNLTALNIACDLLEQHTGHESGKWGAIVSTAAIRVIESMKQEDYAGILLMAEKLIFVSDQFTKRSTN